MSRFARTVSPFIHTVAVATALILGGHPRIAAAKPPAPPPEPTPPGTIYFQQQMPGGAQTWGMDADGKNKFQALPIGVFGNPSSLVYGANHRRWFLVPLADGRVYNRVIHPDGTIYENWPHYDLYAVSVNPDFTVERRKVCDTYGTYRFFPTPDGSFNGDRPDFAFTMQWSNVGLDLFAYCRAFDLRGLFTVEPDGTTTIDQRSGVMPQAVCRVSVSPGGNIATVGQSVEAGVVLGPEAVTALPGNWVQSNMEDYAISPDGQSVLFEIEVYHPEAGGWWRELDLRDLATGNTLWTAAYDTEQGSQWSPLGGTVAFSDRDAIWLMAATQSGFGTPVRIHSGPSTTFSKSAYPRWSPNAGHLAFFERSAGKGGRTYINNIYRMKADGSGVINLTADVASGTKVWPYRWVSNDVAPMP